LHNHFPASKLRRHMWVKQQFDLRKTTLDNGLVVLSEQMQHTRAVSFGVFLRTGSRYETAEQNGLTHFLEHALFKGTRKRSALQIAKDADVLGGNLNAFTGREIVGFHNEVVDEDLLGGFELLADLVTAPAFDPVELDKERNVILEEIKMTEDTPDDILFDVFFENFYPNHPLGRRVLGTPETVATFRDERVVSYYQDLFSPENVVLAAAGNLKHEQVLELAQQYFGALPKRHAAVPATAPPPTPNITMRRKKELEQSHLVLGVLCPSLLSEEFYTTGLLTMILGSGMSSRLFQSVREERGLVYDVYASANQFQDTGFFHIYAGTSPDRLTETISAIMVELKRLKDEPVSADELQRTRGRMRASLILSLEDSGSRLSAMAGNEIVERRFIPLEETVARIEAVTAEDVQRLANEIFKPDAFAVTALGNLKGFKFKRAQLVC
jgi:predicted Zn-dependent peptidase